jgi:hypothetical protein
MTRSHIYCDNITGQNSLVGIGYALYDRILYSATDNFVCSITARPKPRLAHLRSGWTTAADSAALKRPERDAYMNGAIPPLFLTSSWVNLMKWVHG